MATKNFGKGDLTRTSRQIQSQSPNGYQREKITWKDGLTGFE